MLVLLADDQAKVRSALRLMLEQQPDIEILGEAVDATGLLE
jgi:DNA-binding NarL/FixJ family response regulator